MCPSQYFSLSLHSRGENQELTSPRSIEKKLKKKKTLKLN